jgi:hypothetical protein
VVPSPPPYRHLSVTESAARSRPNAGKCHAPSLFFLRSITHTHRAPALHVAQFREFVMNDLVDRILSIYQLMRPLDPDRVSDSRQRITRYIESLASAGQSDAQQLAVYGLAYLKELHEERDPRFTGC